MSSQDTRRPRRRIAVRRAARPRRAAHRRGGPSGARRIRHARGAGALRRRNARRARRRRPRRAKPRRPAIAPSRRGARPRGSPAHGIAAILRRPIAPAGRAHVRPDRLVARSGFPRHGDAADSGEAEPPALAVAEPAAGEAPRVEIASARRFLWSLDAENRFGQTDRALEEAVGSHAPKAGELLAALRARVGLDPAGDLAQAIAARRTFSALRLDWPEPDRASARIALISGTPIFDKERRFAGFRGLASSPAKPSPTRAPSGRRARFRRPPPARLPAPSRGRPRRRCQRRPSNCAARRPPDRASLLGRRSPATARPKSSFCGNPALGRRALRTSCRSAPAR